MSRRRWLYTLGGQALPAPVEVSDDYTGAERRAQTVTEEIVHGGTRATDGTDISTRKKRREYLKATGLADSSDFTETRAKAAAAREAYFSGKGDYREIVETVGRTAYELSKKRKR